jgi:MFS family permease
MMSKQAHTQAHAIAVFALMAIFLCFEMALQVSPGVMTKPLREALHLSAAGLGLMSGVYFVTYAAMQIPSGLLYDRTNFRYLVTFAIIICAAGTALFSSATTLGTGAFARLFMGFGSAFAFLSVLTVAARYFKPKYFAFLTGIAQLLAAMGAAAGELPIAYAVKHIGWRTTLFDLSIFGVILASAIWFFVRKPKAPKNADEPNEPIMRSLKRIALCSQTWGCALYGFFSWAPATAFASLWGVPFVASTYHLPTTDAAGFIALIWLGIGVAAPTIGALSDVMGRRNPLLIVSALLGAIGIGTAIYIPHLPLWLLGVSLFLAGVGSAGQILSFAVVKDNANPQRLSTSIGINNMALVVTGIIVQPLIGKLLSHHSGHIIYGHSTFSLGDYHYALAILPLSFVMCALVTWLMIRETHCNAQSQRY